MNEKQRDGMERAGETGEIIDRRAGERRAAAPVVAVVAADLSSLTLYSPTWSDRELTELSGTQAAMEVDNAMGKYVLLADVQALASQAQAVASTPVQRKSIDSNEFARLIRAWEQADSTTAADAAYGAIIDHVDRFAAQAAVGVASQQEQQPQPSCNAALRAAPESPVPANITGLERALSPRHWTAEMDHAWHTNIPDVYAAFAALRKLAGAPCRDLDNEWIYVCESNSTGHEIFGKRHPSGTRVQIGRAASAKDAEWIIKSHNDTLPEATEPALNVPRVRGEGDDVPITMSTYGTKEACEAEHARRNASPDLASIARQAQGELIAAVHKHVVGVVRAYGEKRCADYIERYHHPAHIAAVLKSTPTES